MWLLFARTPTPAAADWPGRRTLAVIDALAWPAAVACAVSAMTVSHGLVGNVAVATCAVLGVRGAWTAAFRSSHYRFTTWHLGMPLAAILALGVVMKLAA
jgi:hypothetical protein